MSFGELALLSKSPRSGTVLTLTDCFFAMISAESFEKLLMKEKALRITRNIVFLRKVPYIQDAFIHDIHGLFLLCNERKIELRDQIIVKEGDPCHKVFIVYEGEVEIYKQNLNSVFYSHQTGVLGMKEINEKSSLLKSDYSFAKYAQRRKLMGEDVQVGLISSKAQYECSQFHETVQQVLADHVNESSHFKDDHRSRFNQ